MVQSADLVRLWNRRQPVRGKLADLRRSPLFAGLSDRELTVLAAHLDEAWVPAGTVLVREGHRNPAFWLVVEGLAAVSIQGRERRVIGPGGHFGATSMLDGLGASATVVARTPLRALVASTVQFGALTGNPRVSERLRCESEKRLRADLMDLVTAS
ncbi:MAG: cyclic nucleotide-binding domain-containing protein [Chloroflexi bacterium]|nr:MAG: cyclic nucleotide-binding domain-containing protein [Chloroflexota bacterium]